MQRVAMIYGNPTSHNSNQINNNSNSPYTYKHNLE